MIAIIAQIDAIMVADFIMDDMYWILFSVWLDLHTNEISASAVNGLAHSSQYVYDRNRLNQKMASCSNHRLLAVGLKYSIYIQCVFLFHRLMPAAVVGSVTMCSSQ